MANFIGMAQKQSIIRALGGAVGRIGGSLESLGKPSYGIQVYCRAQGGSHRWGRRAFKVHHCARRE
jgi:hypothetical protein